MTYQAGSAVSYYIMDISDAERKAAQLRGIYQSIRQDAASLSQPIAVQATSNTNAQTAALRTQTQVATQTQTATQALIATTIDLGIAEGKTTDQINAQLAAMSRQALASGDLIAANELIDASLGKIAVAQTQVVEARTIDTKAITTQANQELLLAQTQARALRASGDQVGALQLLTTARRNATNASAQSLATTDVQIAGLQKGATVSGAFGAQLSSLVNPVLLVTAAIGAGIATLHAFNDALDFKANLDELNASNNLLLQTTRNTTVAFRDAQIFADKYKLTDQELAEGISESIPVIRQSTSSMEDILSVFTRLTILKPGKTFNDASRAIGELQSGNVVSLQRIFNIIPDDVARMKVEIEGGADAIQVLNKYLNDAGIGTRALELRAQGLKGAYREAAIAAEDLKKAQAELAAGPGLVTTKLQTNFTETLTAQLQGVGDLDAANLAFYQTLLSGEGIVAALDVRMKVLNDSIATQESAASSTSGAILRSADADDRLASSANNAAFYVDKLTTAQYAQNRAELADQRVGERSGGLFDSVDEINTFYDRQHDAQNQAAQDAKDLQSAEFNYARATDNTVTQRKILNEQLKAAKGNAAEELNIKAQLIELDKQQNTTKGPKGITGLDRTEIQLAGNLQEQLNEVNKRLESGTLNQYQRNQLLLQQAKLQEQINDAVTKERDLQNEIALDSVHNQQKEIEENAELAGLRRAANDDRFSAEQQQAIRLREQEIILTQQKRQNDALKDQAELEQTITKSGIGTLPVGATGTQGGVPVSQLPPIGSGIPVGASGFPQVQLASGEKFTINLTVNVDKNGVATAQNFDPAVALNLIGKAFNTQVATGGLG